MHHAPSVEKALRAKPEAVDDSGSEPTEASMRRCSDARNATSGHASTQGTMRRWSCLRVRERGDVNDFATVNKGVGCQVWTGVSISSLHSRSVRMLGDRYNV